MDFLPQIKICPLFHSESFFPTILFHKRKQRKFEVSLTRLAALTFFPVINEYISYFNKINADIFVFLPPHFQHICLILYVTFLFIEIVCSQQEFSIRLLKCKVYDFHASKTSSTETISIGKISHNV